MTREEHKAKILELSERKRRLLLRLATGVGKTSTALEILHKDYLFNKNLANNLFPEVDVLIVVPKLVLISNWKDEMYKWFPDWEKWLHPTFTTYVSMFKHIGVAWDSIILDECHHFTERCQMFIEDSNYLRKNPNTRIIALSGTVPKAARERLFDTFSGLWSYTITAREAMDDKILPDPTVFFVKMTLDNSAIKHRYIKNPKKTEVIATSYNGRKALSRVKNKQVHILCTEAQYYEIATEEINYWSKYYKGTHQPWAKNKWLYLAGERLKWLSLIKTGYVKEVILYYLKDVRLITFCSSIEQAVLLGLPSVHSGDDTSQYVLDKFNEGDMQQITAIRMLDEGVNLAACQVGLFAGLNASTVIQSQRLGRLLRHKNPLIIIPYYVGTRDEEIIGKMMENYNPELVKTMDSFELKSNIENFLSNGVSD